MKGREGKEKDTENIELQLIYWLMFYSNYILAEKWNIHNIYHMDKVGPLIHSTKN